MRTALLLFFCAVFGLNAATTNRIHSHGIDFYFDGDVEYGTFITTNNFWVVPGAANLTNMTPAATGPTNGWEINPLYGSAQGFAANIGGYDADLRIAMPMNITSNCTLVKVIGTGNTAQNTTAIKTAVALTFLTSAPANPEITFRPPYIGHDKPLYTLADLRTNLLPSYSSTPITARQTLAQTVNEHDNSLWMDHSSSSARQLRPSDVMNDYNPENNSLVFDGLLSLYMDDSAADKHKALVYYAQWALDRAYIIEAGYRQPGTGHNPGHRVPAVFGAVMFGLTNIWETCSSTTNFHEDEYIVWGDGANRALWGQRDNSVEYQYWDYVEAGTGSRSHKDPYGFVDGGSPNRSGYLVLTAQTIKSQYAASLLFTNLQIGWSSNSWYLVGDFVKRWVTNGMWYANDPVAPYTGSTSDYGVLYGPDGAGSYIAGSGRFNSYHGDELNGGNYGSSFVSQMWDAYSEDAGGGSGTTPPVVQTVTCASDGYTWTVNYSQSTYVGSGGSGGHSVNMSLGAVGLSYVSGSGSATLTFTGTRLVYAGEAGTYSYNQPTDGMENITGDDVATTIDQVVANNASAQEPPPEGAARSLVKFKGLTFGRSPNQQATQHNHPASPLLFENFEGSGYATAGWAEYISGTGNSINEDNTTNVLSGSQSLAIVGISDDPSCITNSFAASSEVFGYFEFQCLKYPSENGDAYRQIMRLETEDGTTLFHILMFNTGTLYIQTGGSSDVAGSSEASPLVLGQTYHVWWSWNKNNGSNSEATIAYSTTKVKPTSGDTFVSITGNTITEDAMRIMVGYDNTSSELDSNLGGLFNGAPSWIYDYLILDDVEIQSYP